MTFLANKQLELEYIFQSENTPHRTSALLHATTKSLNRSRVSKTAG